jgi:FecR protein
MEIMLNKKSGLAYLLTLGALLFSLTPASWAQSDNQNPNQDSYPPQSQPQNRSPQIEGQMPGNIGEGEAPNDQADPPSRVARISYLDGSVSIEPGGVGDWGAATLNRPVTIGDKLWTDLNSRLELEAGEASIHLGAMTALSFLNLDGNATQIRLAEGRIHLRVREMREGDLYEVDTPNLAFTVRQAGAFRIDVNEDGDATNVTVIRGEGEVTAGGQMYTVHAGERATITGTDTAVQYDVKAALTPDELDRWAEQRDLREENSTSAQHVSREVVGYSDLDDYGTWNQDPTGSVWYPNSVPLGWAPYSNGYWNWVGPWGWTWIDYSPWGFAPFHYGRWIYGGGRWGWSPGPIYARPYYGPAFVGFLGGFHGGFGVGFGGVGVGVGWFPLGWGEAYHPWYHAGPGYWNNINAHNTYIRNVNMIHNGSTNYAYAHNTNAVTVASRTAFTGGQAINRGSAHITEASLHGATVMNRISAAPTQASYFGASSAHGRVAMPSSVVQNRAVVARTTPPAAATHLPVRTTNAGGVRGNTPAAGSGRGYSSPGYNRGAGIARNPTPTMNRQQQIAADRPPSARPQSSFNSYNTNARFNSTSSRTWNAQGNATDFGRPPQGFGTNRPITGGNVRTTQMNQYRPPYANSTSGNANSRAVANRPASMYRAPTSYNGNRSYSPPRTNSSMPSRTYSPPAPRASYGGGGGHPGGGGGGHSHR